MGGGWWLVAGGCGWLVAGSWWLVGGRWQDRWVVYTCCFPSRENEFDLCSVREALKLVDVEGTPPTSLAPRHVILGAAIDVEGTPPDVLTAAA